MFKNNTILKMLIISSDFDILLLTISVAANARLYALSLDDCAARPHPVFAREWDGGFL
jgi:hypothetical protein